MNKLLYISFSLLVIMNLAWALIPNVRDEIHWRLAGFEKTSMQSYVDKWPKGRHFDEAATSNDDLAWDIAADSHTIQGYGRYLDRFHKGAYKALAKKYLESLQWENARDQNTVTAYEKYLSAYPNGMFYEKAKVGILALEISHTSTTLEMGNKKTDDSSSQQVEPSIRDLQEKLSVLGYNPGPIDGIFGESTKKALRSFQTDNKMKKTGLPDPATLKLLGLLFSKGANPSAKSNDGTTPTQFSKQQGHSDIAQVINSKPIFTTYKNNTHKFSIKYPYHWNVLTEAQIKSMAAGMSGTAPSFAAQSPTRESMFVIAASIIPVAEKAFTTDAETGLWKQYSKFTGTPPTNWVRTADSIRSVNGVKALIVEWKMPSPSTQGVVLMQKHMCLIVSKRAFLVYATSDISSWKENDSKWFTPAFESFMITKYYEKKTSKLQELKPLPNEKSVNGRFITNSTAGTLFVVTGRVENPSNISYSYIQIKGALMNKGKIEDVKVVYCGNIISEEMLKTGNLLDISKLLMLPEGEFNTNVSLKPKTSIPFMIVFADLPKKLQNFTLKVINFENNNAN